MLQALSVHVALASVVITVGMAGGSGLAVALTLWSALAKDPKQKGLKQQRPPSAALEAGSLKPEA